MLQKLLSVNMARTKYLPFNSLLYVPLLSEWQPHPSCSRADLGPAHEDQYMQNEYVNP